ncbi:Syo1 protein [Pichia kluyveri]|uniref:Syo1 protein n=1 Tax=Pichia kluyveri TaxID=36015 RepID=A0AAV5R8G3_PICKL|nr:Syo1 protein [Pichia kluyveri]
MAKLKKRSKLSQQRHRGNAIVNPNEKENGKKSVNKDINQSNKAITLLDKLKKNSNSSINDKLITINNILVQCNNDENMRKAFLKNDLVKIILNDLLIENNKYDEILVSSLDLLKHLIIEESYDLSIYLWRNGIWEILKENFTKAFKSLQHLNDSNVDIMSKDLLLNYINNLIEILDNLVMELNSETIKSSIIPKLNEDDIIMNNLFEILKIENINKFNLSIITNILQLIYDLSSISIEFLQNILLNDNNNVSFTKIFNNLLSNTDKLNENSLCKIYLIGINLQIFEIKDNLNDNLNLIIDEIFNITNIINNNETAMEGENFQVIDISLDLLTTIIEIKGSIYLQDETKKDSVFNEKCIEQILPFLGKLFEINYTNNKKLICLNNLIIYLNSTKLINDKLIEDLEMLNNNKILNEFNKLINESFGKIDIETIIDYLNFELNLIEIEPMKFIQNEEIITQINKLIEISIKNKIDEFTDIEIQIQFITSLLMYLSIIAKNINNLEITKNIVEFIIKYNLIEPINFYNNKLTNDKLNISKYHKKYHYLVEESINIAINSIFEMFDDDYSYNRIIYHDGKMNDLLINIMQDYKKIYKNIDKNVNLKLKRQTEETLNNLQRFIDYKKTE